eukprot:951216-Prymnesium_polylepis.1
MSRPVVKRPPRTGAPTSSPPSRSARTDGPGYYAQDHGTIGKSARGAPRVSAMFASTSIRDCVVPVGMSTEALAQLEESCRRQAEREAEERARLSEAEKKKLAEAEEMAQQAAERVRARREEEAQQRAEAARQVRCLPMPPDSPTVVSAVLSTARVRAWQAELQWETEERALIDTASKAKEAADRVRLRLAEEREVPRPPSRATRVCPHASHERSLAGPAADHRHARRQRPPSARRQSWRSVSERRVSWHRSPRRGSRAPPSVCARGWRRSAPGGTQTRRRRRLRHKRARCAPAAVTTARPQMSSAHFGAVRRGRRPPSGPMSLLRCRSQDAAREAAERAQEEAAARLQARQEQERVRREAERSVRKAEEEARAREAAERQIAERARAEAEARVRA